MISEAYINRLSLETLHYASFFFFFYELNKFSLLVEHPWLQNAKKAPNVPLGDVVKSRLKQFSLMNRFKRKALRVCSFNLKLFLSICSFCTSWTIKTCMSKCR